MARSSERGGGRNEETYSECAVGVRIKQLPSRRQQQRGNGGYWGVLGDLLKKVGFGKGKSRNFLLCGINKKDYILAEMWC